MSNHKNVDALVTLRSDYNGKFVRAGMGSESFLAAVSQQIKGWELFGMCKLGGDRVGLQSVHSGKFVRAGMGAESHLAAASSQVSDWESFRLIKLGGEKVALQSTLSGKYVRAGMGSEGYLAAFSSHIQAWETFRLVTTDDLANDFPDLASMRGKQRRVVVILWDPKRPGVMVPSRESIKQALFGKTDSVSQYFKEASLGTFAFEVVAFLPPEGPGHPAWYPAKKPAAHYWGPRDDNDLDSDGFITGHTEKWAEAVWAAAKDFNFSDYDEKKDGKLDPEDLLVCILIPQNGLAGYYRTPLGQQYPDPKVLLSDSVKSGVEIPKILEIYLGNPRAGFMFHEFAHLLVKARDTYHGKNNETEYVPFSTGAFTAMGSGFPANLDPFHRLKYGWLRYRAALRSQRYAIRAAVPHGEALILIDLSHSDKEYFILENRWRTPKSCDASLPDQGLAVWHIIEDSSIYNASPTPVGTSATYWTSVAGMWNKRGIRLIRPVASPPTRDDLRALWDGSQPETGYDLLSEDPNPNHAELRWAGPTTAGTPSGFAIRNISAAGPVIDFDVEVPW